MAELNLAETLKLSESLIRDSVLDRIISDTMTFYPEIRYYKSLVEPASF